MALSSGNSVLWSDMSALLIALNNARTKFGYSTISSLTGGQGVQAKPATLSELKNGLQELTANTYVGSKADTSSIIIPNAGDLLSVTPFSTLNTKITDVNNTCAFDSSFFSSNNSFSRNSSFFSSNNSFSRNSSFFSSNNGFSRNSSFFSSNNGFSRNSSFNSSQNGFGFAFQSSVRSGDNSFSFRFSSSPSHSGFGSNRSYHSSFRGGFSGN